ncbi:MAG: hypothetical protein ACP5M4_12865 [Acidobacteriaceae bacterium]
MLPATPMENPTLEARQGVGNGNRGDWRYRLGQWTGGAGVSEEVEAKMDFPMRAVDAWERIVFFEETLRRPPWILRWVIPEPLSVEGDKNHAGGLVRCIYRRGEIVKHVTALERPEHVSFNVMGQELGIEKMVLVRGGSYWIEDMGEACRVRLSTRYTAFMRPRWLWRPVERWLMGVLHRHILGSMRMGGGA